jgi:hypothetical protein
MLSSSPALALEGFEGTRQQEDDGASIEAVVVSDGSGGSGGGGSGSGVTCTYEVPHGDPVQLYRTIDGVPYELNFRHCSDGTLTVLWIPQVSGTDLAAIARDEVRRRLPLPRLRSAPQPERGVVQVGTWIWVEPEIWRPVTATATIPGLSATVTATPRRLGFDPGDGHHGTGAITCDGPGKPWLPAYGDELASNCMYTYRHASSLSPTGTWTATTSIEWDVAFAATDGSTDDLGRLTTRADQPMSVGEIQGLISADG